MAPPPPPHPRHDAAASEGDTYRDLADYVLAALSGLAPPDGLRGRLARARPAFLDLLRVPVREKKRESGRRRAAQEKRKRMHPIIFWGRAPTRGWPAACPPQLSSRSGRQTANTPHAQGAELIVSRSFPPPVPFFSLHPQPRGPRWQRSTRRPRWGGCGWMPGMRLRCAC